MSMWNLYVLTLLDNDKKYAKLYERVIKLSRMGKYIHHNNHEEIRAYQERSKELSEELRKINCANAQEIINKWAECEKKKDWRWMSI
jgi:hypothetical protein